jgi:ribosomal protein L22
MKINLKRFQDDFKDKVSPIQRSIPGVKLYEMDLSEFAAKQEGMVEADEMLASFTKGCTLNTTKDGLRAPAFWIGFYQTMLGQNWETEGFALSNAVGDTNCIMQFLPGSCTNQAAGFIAEIARAQLNDIYDVVTLNGKYTSNAKAEFEALDAVAAAQKNGRKVWFISQGMAARSFSVPAIDTVLLTYDGGELGSTLQKLSRAFTAGANKKTGNVVSIALDPNREDKVASIVLSSAQKAAEQNGTDVKDELKRAYATFPLFSVDSTGNKIQLKEDDYIARAMSLDASIPLAVNRTAIYTIDDDDAIALLKQIINKQKRSTRAGAKEAITKGKRFINVTRSASMESNEREACLNTLLNQADAFVHNLDVIRYWVPSEQPQLSDILAEADKDPEYFAKATGVTSKFVRDAIDLGLIRQSWVDAILLQVN